MCERRYILKLRLVVASLFSAYVVLPAVAQQAQPTSEAQCIFAGRINSQGAWSSLASGVSLLSADGESVAQSGKAALENAKAVRLSKSALVAQCNGNQALPSGESGSGSKSPAPALSAGSAPIPITSVAYAPSRDGGNGWNSNSAHRAAESRCDELISTLS